MYLEQAIVSFEELTDNCKHKCRICGHTLKTSPGIWRHIEWNHEKEVSQLTYGQVHNLEGLYNEAM